MKELIKLAHERDIAEKELAAALQGAKTWTRSICPICGRSYPHLLEYQPITCGRFDCLQDANKKGLFEDQKIADSMRDYWKHQADGAE